MFGSCFAEHEGYSLVPFLNPFCLQTTILFVFSDVDNIGNYLIKFIIIDILSVCGYVP